MNLQTDKFPKRVAIIIDPTSFFICTNIEGRDSDLGRCG